MSGLVPSRGPLCQSTTYVKLLAKDKCGPLGTSPDIAPEEQASYVWARPERTVRLCQSSSREDRYIPSKSEKRGRQRINTFVKLLVEG